MLSNSQLVSQLVPYNVHVILFTEKYSILVHVHQAPPDFMMIVCHVKWKYNNTKLLRGTVITISEACE